MDCFASLQTIPIMDMLEVNKLENDSGRLDLFGILGSAQSVLYLLDLFLGIKTRWLNWGRGIHHKDEMLKMRSYREILQQGLAICPLSALCSSALPLE